MKSPQFEPRLAPKPFGAHGMLLGVPVSLVLWAGIIHLGFVILR